MVSIHFLQKGGLDFLWVLYKQLFKSDMGSTDRFFKDLLGIVPICHLQLYSLIADYLLNTVTKGFREICEKIGHFSRGTVKSF
jgi:hypothetical protein